MTAKQVLADGGPSEHWRGRAVWVRRMRLRLVASFAIGQRQFLHAKPPILNSPLKLCPRHGCILRVLRGKTIADMVRSARCQTVRCVQRWAVVTTATLLKRVVLCSLLDPHDQRLERHGVLSELAIRERSLAGGEPALSPSSLLRVARGFRRTSLLPSGE